jgi:hypothetical protein
VGSPVAGLAALALLALAGPLPPAGAGWDGCDNHGAIVQVGQGNRYACEGECSNHGVVVMVGPGNRYDCSAGCRNEGVVANAGGRHCGDGTAKACAGEACLLLCPCCGTRSEAGCPSGPAADPRVDAAIPVHQVLRPAGKGSEAW